MKTDTASRSETGNVRVLWDRLGRMEAERRFDGHEYPSGIVKFPFRLTGQGFFPGGDGLWRNDGDLDSGSDGALPSNGVMFIGNDFGSLKSFKKLKRGFENPLTWRHIKARVIASGISPQSTFFTNAFVGLREEGRALDQKDWENMPIFCDFCTEFLAFQLEQVSPKLIVLMGPKAQTAFDSLISRSPIGKSFRILRTCHPYGDFNFTRERRSKDAMLLAEAWAAA